MTSGNKVSGTLKSFRREKIGSRRFFRHQICRQTNFPKLHFPTTNFPKDIFSDNQNYNQSTIEPILT